MPGTDMNVTPDMAAPIVANATRGHGAFRLPVKNVELSLPRPARHDTNISSAKYAAIVSITIMGVDTVLSIIEVG